MESALKDEEEFKKLKEAVQRDTNDLKATAGLALIYIKRGKLEKGKPLFDTVVKHDPNNKTGLLPELYVNLGLQYGQNAAGENEKDYFQKAEKHFQIVIDKYSDSESYEPAQYYLGVTYAIQGKSQLAIATLEMLSNAKDDDIRKQAMLMLQRVKSEME